MLSAPRGVTVPFPCETKGGRGENGRAGEASFPAHLMIAQDEDAGLRRRPPVSSVGRSFGMNSDQQVFTREELRERRALIVQKRKEKIENKKRTKAEQATELKARMILCVAIIITGGAILWWLDGRPSF